jgi:hypothetical protein
MPGDTANCYCTAKKSEWFAHQMLYAPAANEWTAQSWATPEGQRLRFVTVFDWCASNALSACQICQTHDKTNRIMQTDVLLNGMRHRSPLALCDLKTKALGSLETSASQINDSAARILWGAVTGITVRSSLYKATLSHWGNYTFPKNSKCEASIMSRTLLFCAVTSGKNKTFLEFGFIRYSVWRYVLTRWVDTENKNARHTHSQQLQDYPHIPSNSTVSQADSTKSTRHR